MAPVPAASENMLQCGSIQPDPRLRRFCGAWGHGSLQPTYLQRLEGILLQAGDTIAGSWDMLPIKYIWEQLFSGGKAWNEAYFGDLWGGLISSVAADPGGAAAAVWGDFIAADHWGGYAGDGAGRVTANVLMLLAGGTGALKALKGLKDLKGLRAADAVQILKNGDHFKPDGTLKPNVTYKAGEYDYIYTTDGNGHISSFHADQLQLTNRTQRLPHNPNTPGKLPDDHAGHLVGDRFGGSPELDNLVSQLKGVNQSTYRKLEIQWAKALDPDQPGGPKQVIVDMKITTDPATGRPTEFNVRDTIDGKRYSEIIPNE